MKTLINFSAPVAVKDNLFSQNVSSRLIEYLFKPTKEVATKSKNAPAVKKARKKITLFIVDDDSLYVKALELSISSYIDSLAIFSFRTGEECMEQMKKKPAIVILDYYLNSEVQHAKNGLKILKQIKKVSPKTKVIMLYSQYSLNLAIDCIENGAYDYISKTPTALIRINNIISNIVGNIEVTSLFFRVCEYILLIITLLIIAYTIFNH
ncbi:MAG: response regulator transcription factor [Bacteroidia bacterium]